MTERVDERKRQTLRRFAAVGATAPLVGGREAAGGGSVDAGTGAGADPDTNETREAIRGYVASTPGAHFSKLRDDLRLGTGETQHHLRRLESDGEISSHKDGDYRRYVRAGQFDAFERRALGFLRRTTARGIIIRLLEDPETTGAAIASDLGVSPPSVSAAAAAMSDAGLLDRTDGYELRQPTRVVTLIVRYADSFGPDAVALADNAAALVTYDP